MFQQQRLAKGAQTALNSHGFLAGGEICKLRYGLLSESSRRLYFWRPPRTRSRRTPVGEEKEKVSELFNITSDVSADFRVPAMAKSFRATPLMAVCTLPHGQPQARWLDNHLHSNDPSGFPLGLVLPFCPEISPKQTSALESVSRRQSTAKSLLQELGKDDASF